MVASVGDQSIGPTTSLNPPRLARASVLGMNLLGLVMIFVVAVAIRLVFVAAVSQDSEPGFLVDFDPIYYHRQALTVADGRGFIAPYALDGNLNGPSLESAAHPPGTITVLAAVSKLGLRSFTGHRIVVAMLGALAAPVVALLAARLSNRRAGYIAGYLIAVLPSFWLFDGLLMPEGLAGTLTAAVLLALVLAMERGGSWSLVAVGGLIGLAALTRGELLLLLPVALAVGWVSASGQRWVRSSLLVVAGCLVVLAPWIAFNQSRFEKPVVLTTASDTVLAGANCPITFYGPGIGSWSPDCVGDLATEVEDESVVAARLRRGALSYARSNVRQVPLVGLARLGRMWELYKPGGNVDIGDLQRRPRVWTWVGVGALVCLLPLGVVGARRLRRDKAELMMLLAMPVIVSVTALVAYGNPRFRRPAEISLVVFAAIGADIVARRVATRRDDRRERQAIS